VLLPSVLVRNEIKMRLLFASAKCQLQKFDEVFAFTTGALNEHTNPVSLIFMKSLFISDEMIRVGGLLPVLF
jgi:hypothetical protein